jgi:succinyl-CoA synthetase beta subunit
VYRLTEDITKARMRDAGLPVPEGGVAQSPEEASSLAQKLGNQVVIKALIPTGRRGKLGAVKLVSTND